MDKQAQMITKKLILRPTSLNKSKNYSIFMNESNASLLIRDMNDSIDYMYYEYKIRRSEYTKLSYVITSISKFLSATLLGENSINISMNIYDYLDTKMKKCKANITIQRLNNTLYIFSENKRGNMSTEHIFCIELPKTRNSLKLNELFINTIRLYFISLSFILKCETKYDNENGINNLVFNSFIAGNKMSTIVFHGTKDMRCLVYDGANDLKDSAVYINKMINLISDVYKVKIPEDRSKHNDYGSNGVAKKNNLTTDNLVNHTAANKTSKKLYTIMMMYFDTPDDSLEEFEIKQVSRCFDSTNDALQEMEKILVKDVTELNTNTDIDQIYYIVEDDCIVTNHDELIRKALIVEINTDNK